MKTLGVLAYWFYLQKWTHPACGIIRVEEAFEALQGPHCHRCSLFSTSLRHTSKIHTDLNVCIEASNQERTHYKGDGHRANLHHGSNSHSMGWASKAGKAIMQMSTHACSPSPRVPWHLHTVFPRPNEQWHRSCKQNPGTDSVPDKQPFGFAS